MSAILINPGSGVWTDDEITPALVDEHAGNPDVLLIAPHPAHGLTPAHIQEIRTFLAKETPTP